MRWGRKSGWGGRVVLWGFVAASLWTLVAPVSALATDSDQKHLAVLKVKASGGYTILVIASSERADGRGQVGLIVYGKNGSATYGAPATITATRFEADLGGLGRIALDVVPSGRTRSLRTRCGDEPHTVDFEPQAYRGTFEFHGEEGFAEASTGSPPEYTRFLVDLLCGSAVSGELGGRGLPGARLRLRSRRGPFHLALQANKNRPRAGTRFEVETRERRGRVAISRSRTIWAGSGAFAYDPLLRTATLDPPPPFSGQAAFRRDAAPANRWTGNLTVDLPGRSDVPLTGAGVGATLSPACWQGEGAGGRAECGFPSANPHSG
jgi:hypothetical protein